MDNHRTWIKLLAVIAIAVALSSPAGATTLADLLAPNQSITVGDLQFSGFSYSPLGDMPAASDVTVAPYSTLTGQFGLTFSGNFQDLGGGDASTAVLGYQVSETSPTSSIIGALITGDPAIVGGTGVASVTETFLPQNGTDSLSIFSIVVGSSLGTDNVNFSSAYQSLNVQNAVLAMANGTSAGLTFFTPAYTSSTVVIPEPSSAVLLGVGLLAIGGVRIARIRQKRGHKSLPRR